MGAHNVEAAVVLRCCEANQERVVFVGRNLLFDTATSLSSGTIFCVRLSYKDSAHSLKAV